MSEIKLKAAKRDLVGRKVKRMRGQGLLPANVYGKTIKSQALSIERKEFEKVYQEAGETGVVKLLIEGDREERPILIQNLQTHPVTDEPLHVDLRQIILTEKVTAKIPLELSGEAPAVTQKLGILIQTVSEIEVEALPMDFPEKFIVDVSRLLNVREEIKVRDLAVDRKKLELKAEDELVVAKIEPLAVEEVAPPPPTEEVPVGGEKAPVEGEEKKEEETSKKEKKTEVEEEKKGS